MLTFQIKGYNTSFWHFILNIICFFVLYLRDRTYIYIITGLTNKRGLPDMFQRWIMKLFFMAFNSLVLAASHLNMCIFQVINDSKTRPLLIQSYYYQHQKLLHNMLLSLVIFLSNETPKPLRYYSLSWKQHDNVD